MNITKYLHKQNTQPVQTAPVQIAYFSAPNQTKKQERRNEKKQKHLKLK